MSTKPGRIGCDTPRSTLKMKLPIPSRSFKSMPSNVVDFFSLWQLNILTVFKMSITKISVSFKISNLPWLLWPFFVKRILNVDNEEAKMTNQHRVSTLEGTWLKPKHGTAKKVNNLKFWFSFMFMPDWVLKIRRAQAQDQFKDHKKLIVKLHTVLPMILYIKIW